MAARGGRSGSTSEFGSAAGVEAPSETPSKKKYNAGAQGLALEFLKKSQEQAAEAAAAPTSSKVRLKPIMGGPDGNIPMDPRNPSNPLPLDRRHPAWDNVVGGLVPSKPISATNLIGRARSVKETSVEKQEPLQGPKFFNVNGKRVFNSKTTSDVAPDQFFRDRRTDNARKRAEADAAKSAGRGYTGSVSSLNAGLAKAATISTTPGARKTLPKADIVQAIQGHAATLEGYLNRYANVKFLSAQNATNVRNATDSLKKVHIALAKHSAAEERGATAIGAKHLWDAAAHLHSAHTHLDQPEISAVTHDRPAWEVPLVKGGISSDYGLTTEHLLLAARQHYTVQKANEADPEGNVTKSPEGDKPLKSDQSPEADYARQVREQTTNTKTKVTNPEFSNSGSTQLHPTMIEPGIGSAEKLENQGKIKSAKQAPKQSTKTVLGTPTDLAAKASEINEASAELQRRKSAGKKLTGEDVIPRGERAVAGRARRAQRKALQDALTAKDDAAIASGVTTGGRVAEPTEDYKAPEERAKDEAKGKKPKAAAFNPFDELVAKTLSDLGRD